jgi:transposase
VKSKGQEALFIYRSMEDRIDPKHPLRAVRAQVDAVLVRLAPKCEAMYSRGGRPSIPPEHLLKVLLLQLIYSIRSERQLVEQIEFSLLYRWFVGLSADAAIWHHSTFTRIGSGSRPPIWM